ncbi:MAG TPA: 4-hydroxy-tetrahydrodipicolinate reductase [Polyangiaceae bacterium]
MRLAVVGASGRMGRAVVRLAHAEGVEIVCAVGATDIGRDVGELAGVGAFGTCIVDGLAALEHARAEVVVDFSSPGATLALAQIAAAAGTAVVSGTTGLGDDARAALDRAATRVPVLWEPNMSLGVHVLTELVRRASTVLAEWDAEIVETHHRAKVDAPSGTALRLAESTGRARVGMHALRGGDVVGDHAVHFLGGGERIELTHRATSRDVFAHGALRAARWIVGRPPGRYALRDVLG